MENTDRQLRYFVKISELKSLSRAADALDLTQSGISRQLASLEAYVGKPLFSRTGRGVELTRAGERLFDVAKAAYANIDDALESVRDKEGVTQGHIRIAVIHTLSYYFMSDVVAEFMVQRESVNLSLISRSSPEVVALVESGKADIGFVYDSAVDSAELQATPLFEDEMCMIAREDSVWPDDIDLTTSRHKLVGFPPHYALRKMLQGGGLAPEFVAEAETIDAMLKLVSSGVGACVLPARIPDRLLVDYGLKKLRIIRPMLRRRVVAIVRDHKHCPPLVREVVKIALAKVR
ncbi:LysR family transcriptional regulator [Bradyrhizobium sp. WSM3983]|uniref:LysR family transcriptional regulator n=1 Tax=Bradyrhizobium sp. WSM3983 TaxID=1038867 RepID=UPI0004245053|nr:LysR family transcriptional regulator [Bradyrhizobium sp. WSM3983]